jgi:hypothetical protein
LTVGTNSSHSINGTPQTVDANQMDLNDDAEEYRAEFREDYCSDCGCIADDELCPRCLAEIADAQRKSDVWRGDRRWNGQIMARRRHGLDMHVLEDIRE